MDTENKEQKGKNIVYIVSSLFIVAAMCFYFAAQGWGWGAIGANSRAVVSFISLVGGVRAVQSGLLVIFTVFFALKLLKGLDKNFTRFAGVFFLIDACISAFCFMLYLIIVIANSAAAGGEGGAGVAVPTVALVYSLLRAGGGVVLFLAFKGILNKSVAAILSAVVAGINIVLFFVILFVTDLGLTFSYMLLGLAVLFCAAALHLFFDAAKDRTAAAGEDKPGEPAETTEDKPVENV